MPNLTLLTARTPLTKTFKAKPEGGFDVTPYPLEREVTSITRNYRSPEELLATLQTAGKTGYCALKGPLDRPLVQESRKNHNLPAEPTELLIVDWDLNAGFDSPEELLAAIDPALEDVSFVWQHSSSAGIIGPAKCRGHAFIMLEQPLLPSVVKQWLYRCNLANPAFRKHVRLSGNGMDLWFPLDVTVNQNDKLIYVAPPNCIGFADPMPPEERMRLVKRGKDKFNLEPRINARKIRELREELIGELQDKQGIERRERRYSKRGELNILANPSPCSVTEELACPPYMRVNLEGENPSFGFYYYIDDPEILYNFKGYDPCYLKDLDPHYYETAKAAAKATKATAPEPDGFIPFVFRDKSSDTYFNGWINRKEKQIKDLTPVSSKQKMEDFLAQYGLQMPAFVEDWTLSFDPTKEDRVDIPNKIINIFRPTPYMAMTEAYLGGIPPTIDLVISHLCQEPETKDWFVNWLAAVFQKRIQTKTAWLFSGVEGTGKGALFNEILRPLFGHDHAVSMETKLLDDQFNGFLQNKIVVFIDEGDANNTSKVDATMAKLRNWITEPVISIRKMHREALNHPNFANFIMATNSRMPLKLSPSDRRWNIAPYQTAKIDLATHYHHIADELESFARFLNAFQVDIDKARETIKNRARLSLIELGKTGAAGFFDALREGNLDYFNEAIRDTAPIPANGYFEYEAAIKRWSANPGQPCLVDSDDLRAVYNYLTEKQLGEKAFGWLLRKDGLNPERKMVNGKRSRWVKVTWRNEEELIEIPERETTNVIHLETARHD